MSIIHSENWDAPTVPWLPSGWNVGNTLAGTIETTTSFGTPISSPNMIILFEVAGGPSSLTWGTADSSGGNVSVQGTGQCQGSFTLSGSFSVTVRWSASNLTYGSGTYYEAQLNFGSGELILNKTVGGTTTALATVSGISLSLNSWYYVTLNCIGTAITVTLQQNSPTGDYWYSSAWNSTAGNAISQTDSSVTGSGYASWAANTGNKNILGDNWVFSSLGTTLAVTTSGDTFAASAGFASPATLAHTTAGDSFAASAGFKSPATLAAAANPDTLAASAIFTAPATLAHTTAGDVMASSGSFATSATLGASTAGDVFAGTSLDTHANANATGGPDSFAAAGQFHGAFTMAALEGRDRFAGWTYVNPFLQATEHHDVFAGSATAGTNPAASMAATSRRGRLCARPAASRSIRPRGSFGLEGHDLAAFVATETSHGAVAAVALGDVFVGTIVSTSPATLAAMAGGDVFRAGWPNISYNIYANTGLGDPINFSTPIATTALLTYTTGPLTYPGTWSFDVRAFNVWGEEQNLDCQVTFTLNAAGIDISNVPPPPSGLRAFPLAGGAIRVEWTYPPTTGAMAPTGFHVYLNPGVLSYTAATATVLVGTVLPGGSYVANVPGLTNATTYTIGVRAYNATGEETNTATVTATANSVGPTAVTGLSATATV